MTLCLKPLVLVTSLCLSSLVLAEGASVVTPDVQPTVSSPLTLSPAVPLSPAVEAEVTRLRQAYNDLKPTKNGVAFPASFSEQLRSMLFKQSGLGQIPTQTMVVVDRNFKVQHAWVVVYDADTFHVVADAPISTGTTGRVHHYFTPVGVYTHSTDILGYRAEGTKNENGVRGLGRKGMRVWDFGWQKSMTAWLKNNEARDIRFQMHATDPDYLESVLGKPASKGCVRVASAFNLFIDKYAILDAEYIAKGDKRALSTLHPKMEPTVYPGKYLVVFDSTPEKV